MGGAHKLESNETAADESRKARILLVDEHPITADIERNYLTSVGFEVHLAAEAEVALGKLRAENFDLIMIDTSFRNDKGAETLSALKKASLNREVKAIVTGLSFPPPLKQKIRDAGADELFVKPAPRPQVLKEIKKLTAREVRSNERIADALSLVLKWNDEVFSCKTLDVSSDGVHLSTLRKGVGQLRPEIGSEVEMDIQITSTESLNKVQGEVVRHTQEGFGVRFVKLKKADQKKLDKYILKHSLEQAASHFYL